MFYLLITIEEVIYQPSYLFSSVFSILSAYYYITITIMKITSKELIPKKEQKTPKTSSHKAISRSLTKVKPTSSNIFSQSPNIKPKPLAVIK